MFLQSGVRNLTWVLTGLKSRGWQVCIRFWMFYGRTSFLASSSFEGHPHSFLHLQSQQQQVKFSSCIFLTSSSASSATLKDPCDYIGSTQIIQKSLPILIGNLNFICNLNSLLPYNRTYWQMLEMRSWTSWGGALFGLI